ncbi:MAG TPA: cobalamin-dependent protein [Ardenticatenaceae bacterium]|jgi:methanogenic corrinoid protein MtbC1
MQDLSQQALSSLDDYRAHSQQASGREALPSELTGWLTGDNDPLLFLSRSIAAERPIYFAEYMVWLKLMLAQQETPPSSLLAYFDRLRDTLLQALPAELAPLINDYIEIGLRPLTQPPLADTHTHADLARRYLDALLHGDQPAASHLITEAVERGIPIQTLYQYVLQPCQDQIGLLWQNDGLSVAQEHYCTAVTQLIMAQLYARIGRLAQKNQRAVVACVSSELHDLGARMVAAFLELDGWQITYLGANTPTYAIVEIVESSRADLLALSATMAHHLLAVQQVVRAARASTVGQTLQILVGGYSFNAAPQLWLSVGADAYAPNAQEAVAIANHLLRMRADAIPS